MENKMGKQSSKQQLCQDLDLGPVGYSKKWPLYENGRILVHLHELDFEILEEGDAYFYVNNTERGKIQLVLRQKIHGYIQQYPVLESDYRKLFAMEWIQNVNARTEEDLAALLAHCLIAAEQGLQRMTLDQVTLTLFNYLEENNYGDTMTRKRHRNIPLFLDLVAEEWEAKVQEARAVHRVGPEGKLVKLNEILPKVKLDPPASIKDVTQAVLLSEVAIYPGCYDSQGSAVIVIFCKDPAWDCEHFNSVELAKLIMYYQAVPKEEIRTRGITVLVDARGTTLPVLNALLETLYTVEGNISGALTMVHVLADRVAQSLLFRSPVFQPQINLKINLVTSLDALDRFVKPDQLPPRLGGTMQHNHQCWVHFRIKLEPFLANCRAAAKYLVSVMQEMASIEGLPKTVAETQQIIDQHEKYIQKALEDPHLLRLQENGESVISNLSQDKHVLGTCQDYSDSMEIARKLFSQVQETMFKLIKLADTRLHKLEQCLQLRQYETSVSQNLIMLDEAINYLHFANFQMLKVISWLCTEGEDLLTRHKEVSHNLKGVRSQQKEFEKHYFAAMTQVEKGNDLLEEASLLSQSGNFDEVIGIKEMSKELKARIQTFTGRLEEVREKIEDTARCYHLLDKSYEWALEAMKYVAGMKMENSATPEGLDKLIMSMDLYLHDRPSIPAESFNLMLSLASKLRNDKLIEQCKIARARCLETDQLLKVRQKTLSRAKEQLKVEHQRRFSIPNNTEKTVEKSKNSPQVSEGRVYVPSGVPSSTSCPLASFRRRSYAGKPSVPLCSPTASAFRDHTRDMNLKEYEDYLFSEGLITEDMSDRIVTSLPKGLSDSTMRTSRESLKGSRESLQGSSENINREQKSSSLPKDLCSGFGSGQTSSKDSLSVTIYRQIRPHKKLTRNAHSYSGIGTGMDQEVQSQRTTKSISMVTGSSESLPSMPEEEELNTVSTKSKKPASTQSPQSNGSNRRHVWSPVPVNSHLLMSKQNRNASMFQSMADLRMTEEEVKRRKTLSLIMSELIATERDYVRSLQFVVENYMPELMREDVPQALRGKRNIIFGNLEKIYQFHSQYFLSALEQCEQVPFHICQIFLDHETEFYLYAMYNKNKPKSDELMMEYGQRFFRPKQYELGDKMDLGSYLLKPVQRMGKYALLLKEIIRECPETEPEYSDLKAASEMVKFQLRHGNDLLAMDSLKDCDVNLQEQGQLLRQEEFLVWTGRKKAIRRVFLFEEMVLFSKTKKSASGHDVYLYKKSIKTSDMGMTESVGDTGFKFELWYRRRSVGEHFILQAYSSDVKNNWVREISRLLWKQAIRNREVRLSHMARMGIGNKPCLDLKPSKDNINDRFVNVSTHRGPRSRNSIAVSTFEHLKNGNKRPHSIVSVSSTSSSNSSGNGSLGMFGTPGPVYEAPENSWRLSKSFTISSNESGIVADMSPTTSVSTSTNTEDAFTQTTIKRGQKRTDLGVQGQTSPLCLPSPLGEGRLSTDV